MREIKLSGSLRRFGRSFTLDIASVADGMQALCAMIPGFRAHLLESERRGVRYALFIDRDNVGEDHLQLSGAGTIRLVPVLTGSAKAGVLQTIIGVVLVIVGAAINILSEGSLSAIGTPLIGAGIGMILGGIIQLLTPIKKDKTKAGSTFFDGPTNTVIQGGCVPYLYGEGIVGSVRISAGIDILDTAIYGDPASDDPVLNLG